MYHFYNSLYILYWCMLQNAMPQVEDMARATIGAAQDVVNARFNLRQRCKKNCWIKISLNRDISSKESPAIVKRDAPVETDHVSTCALHQRQQSGCISTKMNHRHILGSGGC